MIYHRGHITLSKQKLSLGLLYSMTSKYQHTITVKFIKVTKTGYNFLNIETNKCVCKYHLYPFKKNKDMIFLIPISYYNVKEI